jgi:hypothetical protein
MIKTQVSHNNHFMYFSGGKASGSGKHAWVPPTGSEKLTFNDFKHKVLFELLYRTWWAPCAQLHLELSLSMMLAGFKQHQQNKRWFVQFTNGRLTFDPLSFCRWIGVYAAIVCNLSLFYQGS